MFYVTAIQSSRVRRGGTPHPCGHDVVTWQRMDLIDSNNELEDYQEICAILIYNYQFSYAIISFHTLISALDILDGTSLRIWRSHKSQRPTASTVASAFGSTTNRFYRYQYNYTVCKGYLQANIWCVVTVIDVTVIDVLATERPWLHSQHNHNGYKNNFSKHSSAAAAANHSRCNHNYRNQAGKTDATIPADTTNAENTLMLPQP